LNIFISVSKVKTEWNCRKQFIDKPIVPPSAEQAGQLPPSKFSKTFWKRQKRF